MSNDESISALDPRRFTPNLHASLVSEILSLRREIESKNVTLGGLEDNVHETKLENTQLSQALKGQVAEVRSIKKQMHLLESGTLSTLGEMAKERDDAVESLSEIRKRVDSSKNKLRVQEEEAERTHGLWDRDRQIWDVEKRNMDRKIHVVEGRLRTILAEVAAAQASGSHPTSTSNDVDEGMRETWFTKSSDTTSNRSSSVKGRSRFSGMSNNTQDGGDTPNFRSSTLSGLNVYGGTRLNGLSLAEELEFDEEEEEDGVDESDQEGEIASPGALPEEAQMRSQRPSAQMQSQDDKARKVLGLLTESNERLVQEAFAGEQQIVRLNEKTDDMVENVPPRYQDNATQFSPPQSPKRRVQNSVGSVERNPEQTEHIANQRRKRVSLISPSAEQTFPIKTGQSGPLPMVSASCQTTEPLSPPMTPVNPANLPSSPRHGDFLMMESTSTQTDDEDVLMKVLSGADDGPFMTVPVIEIHPPSSRPPSSHNSVVLPPRTKNAGCQASIKLPTLLRSISVQTEDTCLTQKSDRLPSKPSLSHGTTKPASGHTEAKEPSRKQTSPRKSSRRNVQLQLQGERKSARVKATAAKPTDSYPGNNDNGPLNVDQTSGLKRPVRVDSLFAGFDISNDPAPQLPEIDFSDDDFDNAAPIRKTLSKVQNSWKLVPHSNNIDLNKLEPDNKERPDKETTVKMDTPHRESTRDKEQTPTDIPAKSSNNPPLVPIVPKGSNIRRTVLILNGTSAHKSQGASSATQSKESLTIPPPFPVPTRSSSRKIPISASEGAQSPTPYSSTFLPGSRSQALGRPPSKNAILRKVRSATAVPKVSHPNHRRSRSRSPIRPTLTATAESPRHPRLPDYDLTPRKPHQQHRQSIPSTSSLISPVIEAPLHTLEHPTSVVDAIAQTMVGEWMWKYVRRRKSFGLSESPQIEFDIGRNGGEASSGSGIRHKRWVWLAPYERAIMWNSKQPTSGPALLGKSGRKRQCSETFCEALSNFLI